MKSNKSSAKEESTMTSKVQDEDTSIGDDKLSHHEELQALIFPKRLMAVLAETTNETAIKWTPDGRAFVLVDKKIFVETVMPKFSPRQSKFSSFLRKLNRWGFSRVSKGPSAGAYRHEFFIRDKPHLASQMYYHNKRTRAALNSDDSITGPSPGSIPSEATISGVLPYASAKGGDIAALQDLHRVHARNSLGSALFMQRLDLLGEQPGTNFLLNPYDIVGSNPFPSNSAESMIPLGVPPPTLYGQAPTIMPGQHLAAAKLQANMDHYAWKQYQQQQLISRLQYVNASVDDNIAPDFAISNVAPDFAMSSRVRNPKF